jgi:hypothetical protein
MNIKDSLAKLNQIDGFVGAALVDSESGMLLGQEGGGNLNLEVAAAGNTEVVRAKPKTMQNLALKDGIEDILITLGKQYHLIRPLRTRTTPFFYVALDRQKSTLFQLAKTLDGLPVLGGLPGTPAALAGVRYGDILLSVNGQRTRTFGEYLEAKALRRDGMQVVIFRQGEEQPIEFEYFANRGPADPMAMLAELVAMRILPGEVQGDGAAS